MSTTISKIRFISISSYSLVVLTPILTLVDRVRPDLRGDSSNPALRRPGGQGAVPLIYVETPASMRSIDLSFVVSTSSDNHSAKYTPYIKAH